MTVRHIIDRSTHVDVELSSQEYGVRTTGDGPVPVVELSDERRQVIGVSVLSVGAFGEVVLERTSSVCVHGEEVGAVRLLWVLYLTANGMIMSYRAGRRCSSHRSSYLFEACGLYVTSE